jgi:hypothetical protein
MSHLQGGRTCRVIPERWFLAFVNERPGVAKHDFDLLVVQSADTLLITANNRADGMRIAWGSATREHGRRLKQFEDYFGGLAIVLVPPTKRGGAERQP